MADLMADIGPAIRRHRLAVGMSQSDLAAKIDVARNTISNWERGISQPTGVQVIDIAHAVGCTYIDLLENRDPPKFHYHGGAYPA